jgi:hypothetical protein
MLWNNIWESSAFSHWLPGQGALYGDWLCGADQSAGHDSPSWEGGGGWGRVGVGAHQRIKYRIWYMHTYLPMALHDRYIRLSLSTHMHTYLTTYMSAFLHRYTCLTLIVQGDAKVDLTNLDVKLGENLFWTLFFLHHLFLKKCLANLSLLYTQHQKIKFWRTFWWYNVKSLIRVPLYCPLPHSAQFHCCFRPPESGSSWHSVVCILARCQSAF